jgi:bifunctional DNA-binding transcriptional regulator/antitoxin component of YhaV-PrlF toxin-antitoxin module
MNGLIQKIEQSPVVRPFTVQMRARGQITVPSPLRQTLRVADGDILTLVQLDSLLLLAPRRLMVPELADRIAGLAEKRGVTVKALLQGLEEEKIILFEEKYAPSIRAAQPGELVEEIRAIIALGLSASTLLAPG